MKFKLNGVLADNPLKFFGACHLAVMVAKRRSKNPGQYKHKVSQVIAAITFLFFSFCWFLAFSMFDVSFGCLLLCR